MFVKAPFELPEFFSDIIREELNTKKVTFTEDVRDFTSYSFKPQLKTVGPEVWKAPGRNPKGAFRTGWKRRNG